MHFISGDGFFTVLIVIGALIYQAVRYMAQKSKEQGGKDQRQAQQRERRITASMPPIPDQVRSPALEEALGKPPRSFTGTVPRSEVQNPSYSKAVPPPRPAAPSWSKLEVRPLQKAASPEPVQTNVTDLARASRDRVDAQKPTFSTQVEAAMLKTDKDNVAFSAMVDKQTGRKTLPPKPIIVSGLKTGWAARLRQRNAMREAIVLREILGPPRGEVLE